LGGRGAGGTSESTVYLVAKAFTTQGGRVEDVIRRKKRLTPPVEPKVTGEVEARVIALACSAPPAGRARWTLRLLEKQVALTEGIPPMDHSTIGRVLKRGRLSLT
jgi:transposase